MAIILTLSVFGSVWADPPAGVWDESESYGGAIRGTWNFSPATRSFQARWNNGSDAILRLEHYDENQIVITRVESSGPSSGLNVRYEGQRCNGGYSGQVTWMWQDQARRGTWSVQLPKPERP